MEYLCNYIETNNLHFLIREWLLKKELVYLLLTALFSASITFFAYKIRRYFDKNQHDLIDTGISVFGYEPTIETPLFSAILTLLITFIGIIKNIIKNCKLNTIIGVEGILNNFFIYISLAICIFLLLNVIVSLVFAIVRFCQKETNFGFVNLLVAVLQAITFYYSLPEYKNSKENEPPRIEYPNFK